MVDLINYLRLEDPYNEDRVPHASDEDAPPPRDESTNEEEAADKGRTLGRN